jgi:hypothetical protein
MYSHIIMVMGLEWNTTLTYVVLQIPYDVFGKNANDTYS